MLRLIRARPDPGEGTVVVLSVDEFALRRGHSSGTLLADIATRRPAGVLPERAADSFAPGWMPTRGGGDLPGPGRMLCQLSGIASDGRSLTSLAAIRAVPMPSGERHARPM